MPHTLLPGNTRCFPLELPTTNLDEYGFFSYYDPNSKPCSFQQEFYRKKYFLEERIGAATAIFRSSIVVHGGLVVDIIAELMREYSRHEDAESDSAGNKRKYVLTSANIHNAWLTTVVEKIEDDEHSELLNNLDHFHKHIHAISDCLSNQFFQLDLITRKWHHIPTFLEDYGPLLKPRMCQNILGDDEFFYMYGGLIPMNSVEIKDANTLTSVISERSQKTATSSKSHINEDQLLLATNELWRLDITSKVFVCLNADLDNSNIPKRFNHHMHLATFIERFEVEGDEQQDQKHDPKPIDSIPLISTYGKKIKVGEKTYIEKPVKKLIIVGGLGLNDEEILKVDVFNLETNKWDSGVDGPYSEMYLDFPVNKEFETSVIIDNPLTGYSCIVVYKKDELSPLQVVPLLYKNTYNLEKEIVSDIHDTNLDEYHKEGLTEQFTIKTDAFDKRLKFLNRRLLGPKMRVFGPNLLVAGFCSKENKNLVFADSLETAPKSSSDSKESEEILEYLKTESEENLVYKTYCFSLMSGKWIEINTRCDVEMKCSYHLLSEAFVWSSHHRLLFLGCGDYRKIPKDSTTGFYKVSPLLQKFDHIVSTGLTLTSLFHKNSSKKNQEISFAKTQQLLFSSQDHNYTLLNYINSSPADEVSAITNLDVKRFKEFAEYSAPLSDLTANKSIMPPYSMLLGKTLFVECGEQIADFEIIPADGAPVLCCMNILRKRWGRFFDTLLAHGYIESIGTFDEVALSNGGSKLSSISSAVKTRKHSSIPSLAKEKYKMSTSQSGLKNSFTANLFSDAQVNNSNLTKGTDSSNYLIIDVSKPSSAHSANDLDISPSNCKQDISGFDCDNQSKKPKDVQFKNSFHLNSQEKIEHSNTSIPEEKDENIAGSPLSRARTSDDVILTSRRGSVNSRITQDSLTSKPHTLTSSSNGMVFRVPFQNNADYNLNENPISKTSSNRYYPLSESISSHVKRLSETRRKSLTSSLSHNDGPQNSITNSLTSDMTRKIPFILPEIDLAKLPDISDKPKNMPNPPPFKASKKTLQHSLKDQNLFDNDSTTSLENRIHSPAAIGLVDLLHPKNMARHSIAQSGDSDDRRISDASSGTEAERRLSYVEKQNNGINLETNTPNFNKISFSTIHDYSSKAGSISSSIRSHSTGTEDSGESFVNSELEALMIPRSLYMPWSHDSVSAFTEFFYTGQINPKWTFQPVALDIFVMSKLYEVPLLYDIMSEVFYSIIGRKEEYVYELKEKIGLNYIKLSKRYLTALNSEEPLESFLKKSQAYSLFRKLDQSLQNIDDGYCDYYLLKKASSAVDFDDENLLKNASFSYCKSSINKNLLPDSFLEKLNNKNYPVSPSRVSDYNYESVDSPNPYPTSEYSGVSPKSSFSRNVSSGLDLKISAMKKNSLQKTQMSKGDSMQTEPEMEFQSVQPLDLIGDNAQSPDSSCDNLKQYSSMSYNKEQNQSLFSNKSYPSDLEFTDINDLLTSDYDLSTSSDSDVSDDNGTNCGSVSGKSDFSSLSKTSNTNYGFGLLSSARINRKVEQNYLEEPNDLTNLLQHKETTEGAKSQKGTASADSKLPAKEEVKRQQKLAASLTLEQLGSTISHHPVEFIIGMIYEVASQAYDLMLTMRARNCLELCKMYKSVIGDMKKETQEMENKIADVKQQQQDAQKAKFAHNMNPSASNVKLGQSITRSVSTNEKSSAANLYRRDVSSSNASSTHNIYSTLPSKSTMNRDQLSTASSSSNLFAGFGMTKVNSFSVNTGESDSEQDKKSIDSSNSSSMSRSTGSKKRSILDNVKPLKPKRSMSILNLFKKNTSTKN